MQRPSFRLPILVVTVSGALWLGGCASSHASGGQRASVASVATASPRPGVASTEQAVATEQSPAGDIPDTQAFVSFTSSVGGYSVDTPEGWARTATGPDVQLVDKLDGEAVTVTSASTAPTTTSARGDIEPGLMQAGRAVQVTNVEDVRLPGGSAVRITYTSNSDPNAVTGKQVRLENQAYLFFAGGKLARLTLWAPLGSDNVDQWQHITQSFRWS